ncbi:MAG: PrsW family glutamic-type intramembrane protease [Planctomycetota bacterium]
MRSHMGSKPRHDPSVEFEPHLRQAAPSDALDPLEPPLGNSPPSEDAVEHTVWDEPSLVAGSDGKEPPAGQVTYKRWLAEGIANTSWGKSWAVTLALVLAAGPFGILGAFASGSIGSEVNLGGVLAIVVLAPVTEEITKVAGALWVVEKRPFWFKSLTQVLLCAAAGGFAFATIENLIYMYVYNPSGNEAFRAWRWSICTALHVNCSMLAGWGLVRIWSKATRTGTRPELVLGTPLFALAMIAHGTYNLSVTIAEVFGWLDFD